MNYLIIIIKSEVSIFSIVVIISYVVCLRSLYHRMLSISYISHEIRIVFLLLLCSLMMCPKTNILWPDGRIRCC